MGMAGVGAVVRTQEETSYGFAPVPDPEVDQFVTEAQRWLAERDAEKKPWRKPAEGICKDCGAPVVEGKCPECSPRR